LVLCLDRSIYIFTTELKIEIRIFMYKDDRKGQELR